MCKRERERERVSARERGCVNERENFPSNIMTLTPISPSPRMAIKSAIFLQDKIFYGTKIRHFRDTHLFAFFPVLLITEKAVKLNLDFLLLLALRKH